eukprot:751382-Hanusia_phi.AAC.2
MTPLGQTAQSVGFEGDGSGQQNETHFIRVGYRTILGSQGGTGTFPTLTRTHTGTVDVHEVAPGLPHPPSSVETSISTPGLTPCYIGPIPRRRAGRPGADTRTGPPGPRRAGPWAATRRATG